MSDLWLYLALHAGLVGSPDVPPLQSIPIDSSLCHEDVEPETCAAASALRRQWVEVGADIADFGQVFELQFMWTLGLQEWNYPRSALQPGSPGPWGTVGAKTRVAWRWTNWLELDERILGYMSPVMSMEARALVRLDEPVVAGVDLLPGLGFEFFRIAVGDSAWVAVDTGATFPITAYSVYTQDPYGVVDRFGGHMGFALGLLR